jgi:hypothetical protein
LVALISHNPGRGAISAATAGASVEIKSVQRMKVVKRDNANSCRLLGNGWRAWAGKISAGRGSCFDARDCAHRTWLLE